MSNKYTVITGLELAFPEPKEAVIGRFTEEDAASEVAGLSWREAKKQLRAYYLNKAVALRSVTEKDYFNNA